MSKPFCRRHNFLVAATLLLVAPLSAFAATPAERAQAVADKALDYLRTQQKPDGGWQGEKDPPGITAIVLRAFVLDSKYDSKTDFVKKGFDKLLSYQLDNGGIYRDLLANYNTAIAVSALAAAEDPAYQPQIDRGVAYLKKLQWSDATRPEKEAVTKGQQVVKDDKDVFFGGWGYGGNAQASGGGRPDLSNTQMTLEALRDAGLKPEDAAFQNAVKFAQRLQNRSESNDQPWAGNDGGFVYSPGADKKGETYAGELTSPEGDRRLRSYGSMTYAGLKSFIYAGLTKDDPRVKAAWAWVTSKWTLDENPGIALGNPAAAMNGVYYYYHVLARALNVYDEPVITDPAGKKHDWRVELITKMESLQKSDGSFAGEARWMEANPVLATSYVVLALEETLEDLRQHPPME